MLVSLCLLAHGAFCAPAPLPAEWGNLEGQWLFRIDPSEVGERDGWQKPDWSDADWRTLDTPGYWEPQGITDVRPGEQPRPKDGMPWTDYDGVAWYRLHFVVPKEWAGQSLVLNLGSVDDQDRTFLNGKLVGATGPGVERSVIVSRRYTIPPDAVRFGEENVLAVRVLDGGGPGGLMGPLLTLLPKTIAEAPMKLPQANRPLADRFANPPAQSRILKIIHGWPDDPREQDGLIAGLIGQGFGGVVCNVSFTDYLESEAKWQAFVRAVKAAKDAGMSMWLYDEKGYPSGTAGGITLRDHPEWQARGLLVAEATSDGGPVALDTPPGKLFRAVAFPVSENGIDSQKAVDLAGQIADGKLAWQAPPGHWRVMVITESFLYEGTHSSMSVGDRRKDINLLMPEPTARFLQVTHDAYAAHLGNDLGRWCVSTFTDEPSLFSYFMRPMPYRPLPWAPNLPNEFRKRRGYALEPVVPLLIADAGGGERKVRYDFWQTIGELVAENFFGQIQANCRQHHLLSGGHPLLEESLLGHVSLYGDFFRCIRRLDAPSIDCLTSVPSEVPWYSARLLSSAGELEGHTVTMCETSDFAQVYRPAGDTRPVRQVTEDEIRGTCNRLMASGINTITSYYSFAGLTGRQLRRLNEWVGRCCTVLAGGHQVADIALVYPTESLWPKYVPARHGATDSPAAAAIEQALVAARSALYAAGRDFIFVDSRALAEAKVQGDALVHGALRWRVVILPGVDTLPTAAWENLARFVQSGGVVIDLGALPANSDTEFPSAPVEALAHRMFGRPQDAHVEANPAGGAGVYLPQGSAALLPLVLDALLEPDVAAPAGQGPLRVTHRRVEGAEVYFLINDDAKPWRGEVTLASAGRGEQWDPATGQATPLPDAGRVPLDLGPYGGVLLRFPAARPPKRFKAVTGALPGMTLQPIPLVEPTVGQGEFVQAESSPDARYAAAGRPAWRAVGTLTKGKTDTFLFFGFQWPAGVDLSGATCLALDSWVPESQQTPAHLLVILTEKDGGQYLADTGRTLAAPGHAQSFVPLTAFDPAGWAKDPDGRLDLTKITGMSIGWGGYFGTENERVEFSLALPQLARLNPR